MCVFVAFINCRELAVVFSYAYSLTSTPITHPPRKLLLHNSLLSSRQAHIQYHQQKYFLIAVNFSEYSLRRVRTLLLYFQRRRQIIKFSYNFFFFLNQYFGCRLDMLLACVSCVTTIEEMPSIISSKYIST